MSRFWGRKAASILLLVSLAALGISLLFQSRATMPLSEVKPRKLRRTLVYQGWVWIDQLQVVCCPVAGPIRITKLLPEGTKVKKGDLVCELDASGLKDRLGNLTVVAKNAEVDFQKVKLLREAAEIAVTKVARVKTSVQETTIKELNLELERKRSVERAKWSEWELAESRIEACRKQIARCTIYAQADGPIVRAEEPHPNPGGHRLEEGATVKSWDKILSVFDVNGEIRVTTKVPKKMIERVHPGLQAQITLDTFPEKTLSGVVAEVAPLPDPSSGGRLISDYTVRIKVEKGFPGIRPEMKAEVKIFLDGLDDVLSVPVQAVVHSDRMDLVAFQRADGGFTWRPVTLGDPTDGFVEIVHGVEGGELVALDPQALIREENQRGDFGTPSNPANKQSSSRRPPSSSKTKKYARIMTRLPSPSPPPPLP